MLRRTVFFLTGFLFFALLGDARGTSVVPEPATKAGSVFTPEQKAEIQQMIQRSVQSAVQKSLQSTRNADLRKLIQEILTKNFKHLQEALGIAFMIASEAAEKETKQEAALKTHKKKLFENKGHPFIGNPEGKKIAIIFTDPYCGHCHQSFDEFETYIKTDKDVKLIIYNYPLFGKDSRIAVEAFLAAHLQKQYINFYKAFRKAFDKQKKALLKEDLLRVAQNSGLNIQKFNQDLQGEEIKVLLKDAILVGKDFNITGTPTFIVQRGGDGNVGRVIEGIVKPQECFVISPKK